MVLTFNREIFPKETIHWIRTHRLRVAANQVWFPVHLAKTSQGCGPQLKRWGESLYGVHILAWCCVPASVPHIVQGCGWKWAVRSRNGSFKGGQCWSPWIPYFQTKHHSKNPVVTHCAGLEARKDPWHHAWGVREASDWWRIAEKCIEMWLPRPLWLGTSWDF